MTTNQPDTQREHRHGYRWDISTHWCEDCDTCTDFCEQINPF